MDSSEPTVVEETIGDVETPGVPEPVTPAWRAQLKLAAIGLGIYVVFYLAMTLFNAWHPKLPVLAWVIIAPGSTIAYLLVLLYAIRCISPLTLSGRQIGWWLAGALVLYLAPNPVVHQLVRAMVTGTDATAAFAEFGTASPTSALAVVFATLFMLAGIFGGMLVARMIRERALLVPVALVSGLIDFWGVYWGPVNFFSERAPLAVGGIASATSAAPTVPPEVVADPSVPEVLRIFMSIAPPEQIGIGDYVFIAFFMAVAARMGMSLKRMLWGIFGGLLLASIFFLLSGHTFWGIEMPRHLPGLAFICSGVLLANIGQFHMAPAEKKMTWALAGILLVALSFQVAPAVAQSVHNYRNRPRQQRPPLYTVKADTPRALAEAVLAEQNTGRYAPARVESLVQLHHYQFAKGKFTYLGLQMLNLAFEKRVTLRGTWEILASARPAKEFPGAWLVDEMAAAPPEPGGNTYTLLTQNLKKPDAPALDLLAATPALPESAYAALDEVPAHAGQCPEGALVIARLSPWGHELRIYPPSPTDGAPPKKPTMLPLGAEK